MRKALFTTYDTELKKYHGMIAEVIRKLTTDECDEADVGMMYKIRFRDGFTTDAFEDELTFEA